MIIKPGFAVIAAVSLVVLTFGNTAHAAGPDFLGYPPSPITDIQLAVPRLVPEPTVEYPSLPPPKMIPADSSLKLVEAPEITAITAEVQISSSSTMSSSDVSNTYAWGQCTWYAKNKRPDLPNALGNGGQWVVSAAKHGFATGSTPRAGAIGEHPGHVVYVGSVNANSTVNISEMNYNGGVGVVHHRTVAADMFTYIY